MAVMKKGIRILQVKIPLEMLQMKMMATILTVQQVMPRLGMIMLIPQQKTTPILAEATLKTMLML